MLVSPSLCLKSFVQGLLLLTPQKSGSQANEPRSEFPTPPGVCLCGRPSVAQERPAVGTGGAAGAELGSLPPPQVDRLCMDGGHWALSLA